MGHLKRGWAVRSPTPFGLMRPLSETIVEEQLGVWLETLKPAGKTSSGTVVIHRFYERSTALSCFQLLSILDWSHVPIHAGDPVTSLLIQVL